jgi:hypothetical protein
MYLDESRPFGSIVVGAGTFWLGYNVGATGWGVIGAVAVVVLYWAIFRPEDVGIDSQSRRVDDLWSAQATALAPSPAEPGIGAVNGGTRIIEVGRVAAIDAAAGSRREHFGRGRHENRLLISREPESPGYRRHA